MSRLRALLILVLVVTLAAPVAAANLAKEIEKRGVVQWEETRWGKAVDSLPVAQLFEKIKALDETPCDLFFGRNVLKNPATGLIGVLTGALGVKVAADQAVEPEEGGMDRAFFVSPADRNEFKSWIAYFQDQASNGSHDLRTSLVLRRKARILKFQLFLEEKTGKTVDQITDADVAGLKTGPEYAWLANDVFEPVTVILNPELSKILGRNIVKTGPAFAPLPSLDLLSPGELAGEKVKTVEGCVLDEKGRFVVRRTDSVVLIMDLEKLYTIDGGIQADSLGDVVGHETFHGIMADLMGDDAPGGPKSQSKMGHDAPIISDYSMGFSEGWAEFFEAWSGEDNPSFDNRGGRSTVTRFILGRQVPIRRNLYTQEDYEKFCSTKKTGQIKNGSQMMATEGLVSGILYALATHDEIPDPLELMLKAMYVGKPQTMPEMVAAMVKAAPDAAVGRAIVLTFLHMTKFATVSGEAKRLYEASYTAKLAWLRARNDGQRGAEEEALKTAYYGARDTYRTFVADLEERILSGAIGIADAVGPELWLDGAVERKRDNGKVEKIEFRFNLNTATEGQLRAIGVSDAGAAAICEARDAKGCLQELTELRGGLDEKDLALLAGFRVTYINAQNPAPAAQ